MSDECQSEPPEQKPRFEPSQSIEYGEVARMTEASATVNGGSDGTNYS